MKDAALHRAVAHLYITSRRYLWTECKKNVIIDVYLQSCILIVTDIELNFQHFFFEILISKLTTVISNIHTNTQIQSISPL